MRQQLILAALVIVTTGLVAGQGCIRDAGASVDNDIRQIEDEQVNARLRRDFGTLDRIWADEFVFTTSKGAFRTKAQVLADYQAEATSFDEYSIGDLRIRVYGETAVVTGRRHEKARLRGEPRADDVRFTRVYVRRKDEWQVVASQVTPILP